MHKDSIWFQWRYKLKTGEKLALSFNSLAFKDEIEDDTGIENNMMQSKMQGSSQ